MGFSTPPFGTIPFDLFALEQWDYSALPQDDEAQWDRVIQMYMSLTPRERHTYHFTSFWVEEGLSEESEGLSEESIRLKDPDSNPDLLSLLTPEKIARVLKGRQTDRERFLGRRPARGCDDPIWVRTCYKPELEDNYAKIVAATQLLDEAIVVTDPDRVLDDPVLYGELGPAGPEMVARLIRRIPSLCDGLQGSVMEDYDDLELPEPSPVDPDSGIDPQLVLASARAQVVVYVVDEEALKDNHVKLLWLDCHGRLLWSNKINPDDLGGVTGAFQGGFTLEESIGSNNLYDNKCYL